MAILNYLPEFPVVEINRSTGLVAGHVIAQTPLAPDFDGIDSINGVDFVANGFIVGLGAGLELEAYDADDHAQPFLIFTEELNTFFDGLKWYATMEDPDEGAIYPRAIGLYVGDVFTTNNFEGEEGAFAKVVDGALTLQAEADADTLFAVEESTLPTGEEAMRFTYVGQVVQGT